MANRYKNEFSRWQLSIKPTSKHAATNDAELEENQAKLAGFLSDVKVGGSFLCSCNMGNNYELVVRGKIYRLEPLQEGSLVVQDGSEIAVHFVQEIKCAGVVDDAIDDVWLMLITQSSTYYAKLSERDTLN